MNISEYDYELPESRIAQTPLLKRDESKLMLVNRKTGEISHERFFNIINYLNKDDVLVLNNTKVLPARLIGSKEETNAVIELLLLKDMGNDLWECLAKPVKRLHIDTVVKFSDKLSAVVKEIKEEGIVVVKLVYEGILLEILSELGSMPLPPYIHEKLADKDRYQTVYAKELGSAAAPTAGFHFTKELLKKIEEKGIKIVYVTLHVGIGTFRPVMEEKIEDHKMHSEYYVMSKESADILNDAKNNSRRLIAVGTTSTRVLETVMTKYGEFKECHGDTNIFIYPGYEWKAIDGLITNFHLPKSTLLMLVSSCSSKDIIMNAYKEALNNDYRFFSFGDAMFLS